jgi:lysosomal acid lipase/cholesteryl ester hydrolase
MHVACMVNLNYMMQDGVTWLLNQPEQNLPTILADQGFDVWISNTRGTRFSNRHLSLQVNQQVSYSLSLSLSKCMHACIYYICFSTVVCLVLITQGYWNWSWDELAKFDLPAVFDYVYNETGQKIHYVGHSQV